MNFEQETILLAVNDLKEIAKVLRKHKEFQLAESIEEYLKFSSPKNSKIDLNQITNTSLNVLRIVEVLEKIFNCF
jgi:hypothetical protein